MIVRSLVMAALALALGARVRAQGDACAGDLNVDGTVSVAELVAAVRNALDGCPSPSGVFYREEFDGDGLDPERWTAAENGYPAAGIVVSDGSLNLGQRNTVTPDFPYIASWAVPFPATGGFRLDVVVQFPSIGAVGPSVAVLDEDDRLIARIRAQYDAPGGLTASVPGAWFTFSDVDATATHTFNLTFLGAAFYLGIDGGPASGPLTIEGRPKGIWLGFPTVGQMYGRQQGDERPPETDDCGRVEERIVNNPLWSTMRVDSITVTRVSSPPSQR